jgi:hypothetical protein
MPPIQFRWNDARVSPWDGKFALDVQFDKQLSARWWNAFGTAVEALSKETNGARWSTIAKIGDPAEGLRITGIEEDSAPALRSFLDSAASTASALVENEEERRAKEASAFRERKRESDVTAARLTETFRSGSGS